MKVEVILFVAAALMLIGGAVTYANRSAKAQEATDDGRQVFSRPLPRQPEVIVVPISQEAKQIGSELDTLGAQVEAGLAAIASEGKALGDEQRRWAQFDRSVGSARTVSELMAKRCRLVVDIYETRLAPTLERYRVTLAAAPEVYSKLAHDRMVRAAMSSNPDVRREYEVMARFSEAAGEACRQRSREVFGDGSGSPTDLSRAEKHVAEKVRAAVETIREMVPVYEHWMEVLDANPTLRDNPAVAAFFEHVVLLGQDIRRFSAEMDRQQKVIAEKALTPPGKALGSPKN